MRASTDAIGGRKMSSPDAGKSKCPLVAELSSHVKENSRSGIVSCLTRIKSDQKCFQRLLENGGAGLLVELLRYRNVKVLDTALSILANACLQSHVREELQGTKIAPYVVWILKNLQSGETMHCRACRLMGNLSESLIHAKALCEAGAINVLTETVRSKTNAQTLGMAVRAIRNIWNTHDGSHDEIIDCETIRSITSLLVQSKKKLVERVNDVKYVELGETCLKALYVFVTDGDSRTGEQMQGEKGLHGYRCIVDYCRDNNKLAIKCLYKLCRNAERRPDLGCSGAIECLVESMRSFGNPDNRDSTKSSRDNTWEIIVCICMFCREAVNRAKIKNCSGLEIILERLGETRDDRYHTMLLNALAQFICDDRSIDIMVKHGLIDVLVDKLKKMALECKISNTEGDDVRKNGKKRSADVPPGVQTDAKYNRINERSERFSMDYPRYDWSPGSTSNGCSSPASTPPLSPCTDTTSDIDENADDNYSPICSDNEWLDNDDSTDAPDVTESGRVRENVEVDDEETVFPEPEEPDNFDEKYAEAGAEDDQTSSSSCESKEHASHVWTLALLGMLSYSNEPVDGLSDPTTIQAIVGYIAASKNHRASVILARIVRNQSYFVPLLLQGFVFEAQTLYGTDFYTRGLCEVAKTGGAFGEIASLLIRGQDHQRFIVAISIPFVIKEREKLRILLNNHGAMNLIFRVLTDPENSFYDEAVMSICRLAETLDIATPEIIREKFTITDEKVDEFTKNSNEQLTNVKNHRTVDRESSSWVTFELDDGSCVRASRACLCEKSVVFSAMLEGSFNESGKSRVRLKKATRDGLATLLSAASRPTDRVDDERPIEAILDAVLLADQFLMTEVSERLTEISITRLNHENLSRAWNWSRTNSCEELKFFCVKIFLASTMTRDQRLKTFRDFTRTTCFDGFVDDVRRIVDASLAPSRL